MTQLDLFDDGPQQPVRQEQRKRRDDLCEPMDDALLAPLVTLPPELLKVVRYREKTKGQRRFMPRGKREYPRADGTVKLAGPTVADLTQLVAFNIERTKQVLAKSAKAEANGASLQALKVSDTWATRFALMARHYHRELARLIGSDPHEGLPFEME